MTHHSKFLLEQSSRSRKRAAKSRGVTLLEMLFVVAVASVVTVTSIPVITTTMTNLHLGSSATSLASGLQRARFLAISTGCQVQVSVSAQNYQVSALQLTGNPPACLSSYSYYCAGAYSSTPCPTPYASSDINATSAANVNLNGTVANTLTLPAIVQFNPAGTVTTYNTTTPPTNFAFILGSLAKLKNNAVKTVSVSGMGYVKVQ